MFDTFWFKNLNKPPLNVPDWIFTPVWIILYIAIFVSIVLYILKKADNKKQGYIYFTIQMILNILWAFIFFGLKNISFAFFDILLLDIFVFLTIKKFYKISKVSSCLLIPYFLWIVFATYLNFSYFILNK